MKKLGAAAALLLLALSASATLINVSGPRLTVDAAPLTGIEFPCNEDATGTTRFDFEGADVVQKFPVTYLFKRTHDAQAGYYTNYFHGPNDGALPELTTYYGAHPFPSDGSFNAQGQSTGSLGGSGTTHHYEVAAGLVDYIETADGDAEQVVKDGTTWVSQAVTVEATGDDDLTVTYYYALPDTDEHIVVVLDDSRDVEASQALVWGDAAWNADQENFCGVLRGTQIYGALLTSVEFNQLEALETDADVLAQAASLGLDDDLWYLNMNPTPDDITDKSGAAHDPAWVNGNHGTLWTE